MSDLCDGSEDRIEYPSIEEYIYSGKLPTLKRVAMASIIEHVNKNLKNVEDFHEAFKLLLPKPLFALICKLRIIITCMYLKITLSQLLFIIMMVTVNLMKVCNKVTFYINNMKVVFIDESIFIYLS